MDGKHPRRPSAWRSARDYDLRNHRFLQQQNPGAQPGSDDDQRPIQDISYFFSDSHKVCSLPEPAFRGGWRA